MTVRHIVDGWVNPGATVWKRGDSASVKLVLNQPFDPAVWASQSELNQVFVDMGVGSLVASDLEPALTEWTADTRGDWAGTFIVESNNTGVALVAVERGGGEPASDALLKQEWTRVINCLLGSRELVHLYLLENKEYQQQSVAGLADPAEIIDQWISAWQKVYNDRLYTSVIRDHLAEYFRACPDTLEQGLMLHIMKGTIHAS